jgi:PleD family two-component response regulator
MSEGRILVVEDDYDIANMLNIYFSGQGFEVTLAARGMEALAVTRKELPHLIVLDIMLPDMDGYAVCKSLRTTTRLSHIPIIFLTQKDERSDRIAGLELGADDYITKPFDIEELKLRVQNAISRSTRESLTDPRTGFPSGRLIEEQLRRIINLPDWALIDCRIRDFDPFREVYGFVAGDDVLRFTSMLIGEIIDGHGTLNDFVGHPGGDNFIIICETKNANTIGDQIRKRFADEVLKHYSFIDREQGFILLPKEDGREAQHGLMTLSIGIITSNDREFSDIREITETVAEARRRDGAASQS